MPVRSGAGWSARGPEEVIRELMSTAVDRRPLGRLPWVAPDACTLPTAERPLRVAEFDDLFANAAARWTGSRTDPAALG